MGPRRVATCFAVILLVGACTPDGAPPQDRPITRLAATDAPLERVLCQLSAGSPGDRDPARKNVTIRPAEVGEEITKKAVVGPFRVAMTFLADGNGAPHLSFAVGRVGKKLYNGMARCSN